MNELTGPHATCYVETVEQIRFGPHSVPVELNANWEIVGEFRWLNPRPIALRIACAVMICPIGIQRFEGGNTEVAGYREGVIEFKVTNALPCRDTELIDKYIGCLIDARAIPID